MYCSNHRIYLDDFIAYLNHHMYLLQLYHLLIQSSTDTGPSYFPIAIISFTHTLIYRLSYLTKYAAKVPTRPQISSKDPQ